MKKKGRYGKKKNVKTARGRKSSSTRWLRRQINDPYVAEAERQGYRSRAAFKLLEMDEKLKLFKPGMTVVDLGAAPGGWCQVAAQKKAKKIVALDLLPIDPIKDVTFFEMDFMADEAPGALIEALGEKADLVLSDMAHNMTGHQKTDHLKIMALVETAYHFAKQVLKPGGVFLAKVFQGGAQHELVKQMNREFETVKHIKPPASRSESSEQYVVAIGFKGLDSEDDLLYQ